MEYILIVKDFNSQQVIFQDTDSNLIYWPREKAPSDLKIGDSLNFSISKKGEEKKNIAKEILNEIFTKD